MSAPTIEILVDGVMQTREAYVNTIDADDIFRPTYRLRPVLRDNEELRESINGYMEIITRP